MLFMCAFTVICGFLYPKLCIAGIILTVIYALIIFILAGKRSASSESLSDRTLITNVTKDFMIKSDYGMMIIGDRDEIIWCNRTCSDICEKNGSIYGKDFSEIITEGQTDNMTDRLRHGETVLCRIGKSYFELKGYNTTTYHKSYCFISMRNTDKEEELRTKLLLRRPIVAILVIDNYTEATRFLGDNHRNAVNAIESALEEWNASLDGI